MENTYSSIAPGYWRAELQINPEDAVLKKSAIKENVKFEEVTEGVLPFVFELIYAENGQDFHIEIINGEERIPVRDVELTHDRATNRDSIFIRFPVYDSYIRAAFETNIMQGEWVVENREQYSIPFVARQGKKHRFTTLKKKPFLDLSGKWAVTFGLNEEKPYPAIGEFKQSGNHLTGTFMTETGDYRFLEGTIQDKKLYLSCFDAAHAFLFEAKILEDSSLIGSFQSGKHYKTTWSAVRNPQFELGSPDELTYIKEGADPFNFTFENTEGKMVSLSDPVYENKVKIVQILGTWCPNCRDETRFLTDYIAKNPNDQLEIIGLAFEKHRDREKALKSIRTYREKEDIPYQILYAGPSDKKEAAKALPMLNHILSYPTMIFLDRENKVRRIHTGFAGPATSAFPAFSDDFQQFIKTLLDEQS